MMTMMKTKRHRKIVELIGRMDIETQEELADRLGEEGYNVTQATVSRDIRELKLTKIPNGKGKQKYALLAEEREEQEEQMVSADRYRSVLSAGIVAMDVAQNLLVVNTVSGMAMAVAAALDAMDIEELVGCIAGDDTILCVAHTMEEAELLMEKIGRTIRH